MSNRDQLAGIAHRAMIDRGLQPDFPLRAVDEATAMAPARDGSVRDLRGLLWASIDNDDSRDLDQLSVAEPGTGGAVRILVAVADVGALVRAGSAVDGHARTNTTSVYTAARIFPMLPERLSTDLTSLNEGQERLAIVIDLTVQADGSVSGSDIYRATVLNRARLTYDAVAAWLDGTAHAPPGLAAVRGLDEQIRRQDRVAQAMKQLRHEHGALTLGSVEARPVFDGDTIADMRPDEKNRAKELIEDFMIAANTATARFLEARNFPSIRRILRTPARWDRIVALAAELGERLPDEPGTTALQQFLAHRQAADPTRFPDLSLSVVKLLGSGEYTVEPPGETSDGHFGLALKDYTHSTAPNRRFPDLITHRLLKAALAAGPLPYSLRELEDLARHCTLQEDNAAKVERQVRKSAAALMLSSRIGERFDAIVTGASDKGTYVRVFHPTVEGRVMQGAHDLDVGDHVHVQLLHADVERGYIDFARR